MLHLLGKNLCVIEHFDSYAIIIEDAKKNYLPELIIYTYSEDVPDPVFLVHLNSSFRNTFLDNAKVINMLNRKDIQAMDISSTNFYFTPGNFQDLLQEKGIHNWSDETIIYGLSFFTDIYPKQVLDRLYIGLVRNSNSSLPIKFIEEINWYDKDIKTYRDNLLQVSSLLQKWKEIQKDQLQFHIQCQALGDSFQNGRIYDRVCEAWLKQYPKGFTGEVQNSFDHTSPEEPAHMQDEEVPF